VPESEWQTPHASTRIRTLIPDDLSSVDAARAARNRRYLESHMPRILHAQMTQAANTEHSDKITGLRWCVSQSAERREPCTQ
jgi:hypothetical protein